MTILYTLSDPLSSMQQSINEGDQTGYLSSVHIRLIFIILVLFSGLLFLPVAGYPISAYISTEPQPGTHMSASEYESQGISLMDRGDWNELLVLTREGLELYPDNAELHCLMGYGLRMTGQYPDAIDNVTFAIIHDSKPIRYANRGFAYLALGKNDDALADAETAIAMNASYPRAYAVKALALSANGNITGAGREIDTALTLDPSDPLFWHLKGRFSAASGDCTGAVDAFNRSLMINPGYVLPWPGFGNATTDLRQTESQCQQGNGKAVPTKASLPVWIAIGGLIVAIAVRETR